MRILKEEYTPEEVEQRVIDARNAIGSLRDFLYILLSALEDTDDFRRSYVQDYVEQVEDLGASFEKDFEDIIYHEQGYDDEEFEESLNEDTIKTKGGKWAYVVQPHKIHMDLYDIRFIEDGAKASSKVFETYDDAVKFIKRNAKYNNWLAVPNAELKDKSDKLTNFGTKIASADINEDTIKTKDGKWVNKGDTGETHGKFKTKKAADAQRKAMFANGWKK